MRRPSGETVDDLSVLLDALLTLKNAQLKEHKDKRLRPLPIYSDGFLLYIGGRPAGVPMQELQERFHLVHSSTSRTCAALEDAGLVHISQHSEDRRRAFVRLTARGQRVIDDVLAAFRGSRR
jgi:DNA-binding MarR family transcriptional regulator